MGKIVKPGMTALCPVPLVMVTCVGADDKPNIITLAWAGVVCSEPPMIGISVRQSRHSHGLIKQSGEFVVNMPAEDILDQADYCGIVSGKTFDKFQKTGLTQLKATQVKAPIIKECPISLECRTTQIISLGTHDLFLAKVLATHIDEDLLDDDGSVSDIMAATPVAYSPLTSEYLSLAGVIGKHGYSRKK